MASHEVAAAVGCLAIPLDGILLGQLIGAFYVGYITFAAVGFAIVLPTAAWAFLPRNKVRDVLLAGTMVIAVTPGCQPTLADRGPVRDATSDFPRQSTGCGAKSRSSSAAASVTWKSGTHFRKHARPRFIYLADRKAPSGTAVRHGRARVSCAVALDRVADRPAERGRCGPPALFSVHYRHQNCGCAACGRLRAWAPRRSRRARNPVVTAAGGW